MIRRTSSLLGAVLLLFHAWVLGNQAWQGQLFEPALLARWAVAAGLAAGVLSLRRRGVSLIWGRKAVALWSLIALLHGPAIANRIADADGRLLPEVVATLAEVTAGAALAAGLVLLGIAARRRRSSPSRPAIVSVAPWLRALDPARSFLVAPRPPPVA